MRRLIMISTIALACFGCTKKEKAAIKAESGLINGFPTWKADTLRATEPMMVLGYDSMITYLSGDTSLVNYHGQKLYVYYCAPAYLDYSDSSQGYPFNCYIGPKCFDTSTYYSVCYPLSPNYWDASHNKWVTALFEVQISQLYPHFDTASNGIFNHYY